jgi:hypothetical protein
MSSTLIKFANAASSENHHAEAHAITTPLSDKDHHGDIPSHVKRALFGGTLSQRTKEILDESDVDNSTLNDNLISWLEAPRAQYALDAEVLILFRPFISAEKVHKLCRHITAPTIWRVYDLEDLIRHERTKFHADTVMHPISSRWAQQVTSLGSAFAVPIPEWFRELGEGVGILNDGAHVPGIASLTIAQALEYDFTLYMLALACEEIIGDVTYFLISLEEAALQNAFNASGWKSEHDLNSPRYPSTQVILNSAAVNRLVALAQDNENKLPDDIRKHLLSNLPPEHRTDQSVALNLVRIAEHGKTSGEELIH